MKNLFNLDNPIFQFLTRVADLVLLQVLFILCSLPIFTMGAAFTALARVTQAIVRDEDAGIARPFFAAFGSNFKQATGGWLIGLLALGGCVSNFLLIDYYMDGAMEAIFMILLAAFLFIVLGILCYLFPLIARYENTLRQHLQNAVVLFMTQLPRTLGLVALTVLPFVLAIVAPKTVVYTLVFWVFAGVSFLAYIQSYVLKPVFDGLEK